MKVLSIYDDGVILDPEIIAMTKQDYQNKFLQAVNNIRAISMATGYHTEASNQLVLIKGFKNIMAMSLNIGYSFDFLEKMKAGAEEQKKQQEQWEGYFIYWVFIKQKPKRKMIKKKMTLKLKFQRKINKMCRLEIYLVTKRKAVKMKAVQILMMIDIIHYSGIVLI